jgi:uncharacterized protein
MSLEFKINEAIKTAMFAKDKAKLEALRAVKAALLLIKTGRDISGGEIPEELELITLQKLVKQRKESADIYIQQNRPDLAQDELDQLAIIEQFLPQQMSEEDIAIEIKKIIAETGATTIKEMGKVMAIASKNMAGKADNKIISTIVKSLLGA